MSLKIEDLFSVKGRVAVITGGGTGIGLMYTRGLAANGAKVYIVGRRQNVIDEAATKINQEFPDSVVAVQGDVSTKEGAAAVRDFVALRETFVDALVNNAAITRDVPLPQGATPEQEREHMWSAEESAFTDLLKTNLSGPYWVTSAFSNLLANAHASGRRAALVVNVSSCAGVATTKNFFHPFYQSSKAALIHLNKVLASRFASHKIRVVSILPGWFASEMSDAIPEPYRPYLVQNTVDQRFGNETEMAGSLIWLMSPAGNYVSGSEVVIDGGLLLTPV